MPFLNKDRLIITYTNKDTCTMCLFFGSFKMDMKSFWVPLSSYDRIFCKRKLIYLIERRWTPTETDGNSWHEGNMEMDNL